MSDSFADLWNSTAPSKPTEPPRTLGSITPNTSGQPRKPQSDVFSLLAASGSQSNSRSTTPSYVGAQRAATGGMQSKSATPPIKKATSGGGDAFSDLLSGVSSGKSNGANLTIAERAALAEKQRLERLQKERQPAKPDASTHAWAGLDALASKAPIAPTTSSRSSSLKPQEDDWAFDFDGPAKPTSTPPVVKTTPAPKANDDWGLDDFISQPAPKKATQKVPASQSTRSLWDDLDDFTSQPPRAQSSRASPAPGKGGSSTPGSFDFGDREDGLLDDQSDTEDDILGALGKPVQPPSNNGSRATPSPQPAASGERSRAVSPPPHIVGQIVEMGFTPQQARVALASTDTGLDVQAALEILLANGAAAPTPPPEEPRRRERPRPRERERERERFRHSDDDDEPPPRIHPRRDRQREPAPRDRDQQQPPDAEGQGNFQDQADKLLAQASEIGLNMFSRANALWNVGKEKVQKAYEEHQAASGKPPAGRKDTRPKWMQDAAEHEEDGWGDHVASGGFKDDHDGAEPLPPHPDERPAPRGKAPERVAKAQSRQAEEPSPKARTGKLFADDAPQVYVSPFRRKVPPRTQASTSAQSTPTPPPPKAASPVPLIQRKTIPASSSALAASAKHKAAGTEMFKLGRYAEAETSYSQAIAALPDSHLLLVPLYNNRALTRIKTGDHTGAIEDCTTVLTMIGPSYHPAREAKVTKEDEGAGVDLADAYVKALRRRAEAYEGKEKWDAARKDWEVVAGTEWAGKSRGEAAQAAGRCRRMVNVDNGGAASSSSNAPPVAKVKPRPKPTPKPVSRVPTPPSEALNRVREANQAAEEEDNQKHALKDSVDARLVAWKGGKETNIRALIASLDTVLWPELGWQKVGMHELVTPSQVKIRYTKAIAKLHPDKLNVNNTTLEQRMIANGVFGSLNEAWIAFKQ